MSWTTIAETDRQSIARWQKGMLMLAILCEIFLAADWYAFAAVLPFVSETLKLNPAEAGLAQGIFALTYGVGMVVWSPVSRSMSARNMLLIGLAGTGLGMVLQVFVQSYLQLVVLRLVIGFFDAGIFIGNMKLIFGWFPQSRRGSVVGLILAAYSLAITMDFALGIPLTLATSWRTFFAVLAIGTLNVAVIDALVVRNGPRELGIANFNWGNEAAREALPLGEIFRSKWIAVGGFGIVACTFAIAGTATWVVPAFITVQHIPPEAGAVIGTVMGLSQVVFLVIGGYMSDRLGKLFMIKLTALLAFLTALMFLWSVVTPLPFSALVLLAAISGIALLGGGAIFALLSEKYSDALAPAAIGYAEVFGIFSAFVAPWLMGAIINASGGSFTGAFAAFAIIEAIIVALLMILARDKIGQTEVIESPAE
ncbi:major facilitator transporter [Bradyrhizobium sp. LTSPM299]|uniref:MFS transporter n=1 Tax=Bradyrhizobium sp. LTSPM299 TaxID=1619233 RepID=UPI0005C8EE66|nr:MFS transporter [Bradyrhizobium sp. LTSPM299]KJC57191.1 major facilitator transporter [Bradyrhizobium sp. LTSPM299]